MIDTTKFIGLHVSQAVQKANESGLTVRVSSEAAAPTLLTNEMRLDRISLVTLNNIVVSAHLG